MKLYEVENGSPEWFTARMGIPTASEFHRIVQPGGEPRFKKDGTPYKSNAGELSEGRLSYACELAVERLLKESKQSIDGLQWVERGKMLEPDAVQHYEFIHDCRTIKAGFITTDDGRYGCSPDRIMVDTIGGLEIKCPAPAKHLQYFMEGPGTNYKCQVQGSLLITGFHVVGFLNPYNPQLPEVVIRFERDEPFIAKMKVALDQFCNEVDEIVQKIRDAGFVPTPDYLTTPMDRMAADLNPDYTGPSDMNAAARIISQGNWG